MLTTLESDLAHFHDVPWPADQRVLASANTAATSGAAVDRSVCERHPCQIEGRVTWGLGRESLRDREQHGRRAGVRWHRQTEMIFCSEDRVNLSSGGRGRVGGGLSEGAHGFGEGEQVFVGDCGEFVA